MSSYTVKETLFKEGEEGEFFFTVLAGRINLYVKSQGEGKARQNLIGELKEGESFGELSMIYGGARSATAVAATGADILVLKKADYDAVVKGDEIKIKAKCIRFFNKLSLFTNIPDNIIEEIAQRSMKPVEFKTSDIIIRQGDTSEFFYIVLKGRVKALRRLEFKKTGITKNIPYSAEAPTNEDYQLGRVEQKLVEFEELTKGDLIGAHEVFNRISYQQSVVATMPTQVYKLQASDFKYVDPFEVQLIVSSIVPCPDDNTLRKFHIQSKMWNSYKHSLVNSLKADRKFKKGFNFRMNPIQTFKSRSISPENRFRAPLTHRKLSPISKIVTIFPSIN